MERPSVPDGDFYSNMGKTVLMPGIIAPTGFFDPAGLARMKTPAQLMYAREAELKHGRVAPQGCRLASLSNSRLEEQLSHFLFDHLGLRQRFYARESRESPCCSMLAALGFPFAEEFHPIFPEDKVPSDFSFQLSPLQTYWPLVVLAVGALETFSIRTFKELNDGTWELKDDHVSGDLGFDPLNLRPDDEERYRGIQERELSNGRLAMIAIAGMVAQELAVRADVFQADEADLEALEKLAGVTASLAMFAASGSKSKSQLATEFVTTMPGRAFVEGLRFF